MRTLIASILLALVATSFAYSVNYKGQQVVRLHFSNAAVQRQALQEVVDALDLDVWHEDLPTATDVRVRNVDELTAIQKLNIPFTVIIEDVDALIQEESRQQKMNAEDPSFFTRYHDYNGLVQFARNIAGNHSEIAKFSSIGKSLQGRDLPLLTITGTGGSPSEKKGIWVQCSIHAREWITGAACTYFINEIALNYGRNDRYTELLDNTVWYILLVTNPDGLAYSWTNDRLWRKNRNPNGGNACVGVDLNRNYGYQWRTGQSFCSETYQGVRAFSEPETTAIQSFLANIEIDGFVDVHSYGQYYLYPWGYTTQLPPDNSAMQSCAQRVVAAIQAVDGIRFTAGNSMFTLYQTFGSSVDWGYGTKGAVYSYTIENRDTGRFGFVLPPNQIVVAGQEVTAQFLTLAETCVLAKSN